MSDRRAARGLTARLSPLWVKVPTVIADAGYESKGLAQDLRNRNGWRLIIAKRREQAFRIAGRNWIVEQTSARLSRHRRMSKDHEYPVQTSQTLITIPACVQMIRQIAPE